MNKLAPLVDFAIFTEPIWASAAIVFVYSSLLLGIGYYTWVALIIAFVPLLLNYVKQHRIRMPTPFDVPILVFMIAVLVGMMVSVETSLSLVAFESCVVMILLYYTIVNYPYPRAAQVSIISVLILLPAIMAPLIISPHYLSFSSLINSRFSGDLPVISNQYFGLIWPLFMTAVIFLGLMVVNKGLLSRLIYGLGSAGAIIAIVLVGRSSFARLLSGESIKARIPVLQATIEMIKEHPATGIGFGCWPVAYNHGTVPPTSGYVFAMPHNAYLDLYVHTGIIGLVAAILAAIVVVRLGVDILRSSYKPFWSGFGRGLLLLIIAISLLAFIESFPFGIGISGAKGYHYIISYCPWLLSSWLVITHRQLTEKPPPLSQA